MLKNKTFLFFLHVLTWSVFLLFPIFVFTKPASFIETDQPQLIIYFIGGIVSICFYYLNYYLIIPNYFFKRKYIIFAIFCISFIILSIATTRFIISLDLGNVNGGSQGPPRLFGNYLLRFLVIFMVAFAFRFYQKMKQIEAEQIGSELERLKAQINPHFLFNTLNGIYGLALTKSDKTAEYILKLSSMMRYALLETSTEKVPLENEINYLNNYIALQKIRLTKTTTVNFSVTGKVEDQQIPPLLFINLIENAFKYGVSNEVKTEIQIHLMVEENVLSLYVKNDKINQKSGSSSHEIGLKNIERRLDLIFENNYTLEIENTEKAFQVTLKIRQK